MKITDRTVRKRVAVAAVSALLALPVATACGGGSNTGAAAKATASDKATHAPVTHTQPVIRVNKAPGTTKNYVGARKDVTGLTCKLVNGGWAATGRVTNPSRVAANYRIYAAFLNTSADTVGLIEVDVRGLSPHASAPWHTALKTNAKNLDCVLRVERTAAS